MQFKCKGCGSRCEAGGICLGCGSDAEQMNCIQQEQQAAGPPVPTMEYCAVCSGRRRRVPIEDGRTRCSGCQNHFEPVGFIMSSRDPGVAAEKDEAYEARKKRARKYS